MKRRKHQEMKTDRSKIKTTPRLWQTRTCRPVNLKASLLKMPQMKGREERGPKLSMEYGTVLSRLKT